MIFYHGTSEEKWNLIREEKILWGYNSYRYTYLTPEIEVAKGYGDVILEVNYDPVGVNGTRTDNYGFDPPPGMSCWQFSVFIPLPINKIKRI